MPAHAARGRRVVVHTLAGLVVTGALTLAAGSPAARALGRSGPAATPPAAARSGPYRVVGLGDSVPAGSACDCTSYVSLVAHDEAARRGTGAVVTNLAAGGLTTSDALDQMRDPAVRDRIADADLVIITVGANDFDPGTVTDDACRPPGLSCYQATLRTQATRLDAVLTWVGALLGPGSPVLLTGYWNVFRDGAVAAARGDDYVRTSVALTRAVNARIAAAARARDVTYVDLFTPFKGKAGTADDTALLAADGDHPDAAGHRAIAAALESALART